MPTIWSWLDFFGVRTKADSSQEVLAHTSVERFFATMNGFRARPFPTDLPVVRGWLGLFFIAAPIAPLNYATFLSSGERGVDSRVWAALREVAVEISTSSG